MDAAELLKLYSPQAWTNRCPPDQLNALFAKYATAKTQEAVKNLQVYKHKFSETSEEERIDFYFKKTGDPNSKPDFNGKKVLVFIHGGYWQFGSVNDSGFMAENFVAKDYVVASVGYERCPKVRIEEIVKQVERGVAKILEMTANSDIYIVGHSAGGHLTSMLLYTDFEKSYNVKSDRIKAIVCAAGIFDLRPMLQIAVNQNLKLNLDEATNLSPVARTTFAISKQTQLLIAYAEDDSPAFKKSSELLYEHVKKFGFEKVKLLYVKGVDHFGIIENISDNDNVLTKEILALA